MIVNPELVDVLTLMASLIAFAGLLGAAMLWGDRRSKVRRMKAEDQELLGRLDRNELAPDEAQKAARSLVSELVQLLGSKV